MHSSKAHSLHPPEEDRNDGIPQSRTADIPASRAPALESQSAGTSLAAGCRGWGSGRGSSRRIDQTDGTMRTMNMQITTRGARLMSRHPRRAVGIGLTVSALRAIDTAGARRRAQHLAEPAKRAVSDHRVHAETHRAKTDALDAAHRVQRIGVAKALTDKRVARKLRHATHHASRAASLSISSPRRHRIRNTTVVVIAAGTLAGAGYAARQKVATVDGSNDQPA